MKVIGNTVGMGLPKPDLSQTDPRKGDFVKGKDKITEAVNAALAQAKESGEFDGKDAISPEILVHPTDGGYTITITDERGTEEFTLLHGKDGSKGDKGDTGATGPAGKTPVKGVDYFTAADQEAIVQQVITALGTPVFGRVDAEKNIVLSGSLAEGNYTVKYEDATGNQTVIGSIAVGDALINMIPISTGADGTIYNEVGYKTNMRLSNSTGNEATHDGGFELTGFIPMTVNDVAYGNAGMFLGTKNSYLEICAYDSSKALLGHSVIYNNPVTYSVNDNGTWVYTPANDSAYANIAYIRVCADVIDENSIITINQPLS